MEQNVPQSKIANYSTGKKLDKGNTMSEKLKVLLESFHFNQNLIIFADTKAVAILTINGILMGFIVPLGKTLKSMAGYSFGMMLSLYICYLLIAFICCILCVAVIYPRPHRRGTEVAELFNIASIKKHFPNPDDSQNYADKFKDSDIHKLEHDYAILLHREYLISAKKYHYVKKSVFFFLISVIFAMTVFTMNVFINV